MPTNFFAGQLVKTVDAFNPPANIPAGSFGKIEAVFTEQVCVRFPDNKKVTMPHGCVVAV
jgi:hypothetical protein